MVFQLFRSSAVTLFIALLFLCLINATPSIAQEFKPALVLNKTAFSPTIPPRLTSPVKGKLHIVAVMVEFEEDDNRFTTGDGTFNNAGMAFLNDPDIRIDPLPHNQKYFEAHLEFANNYFETVSNGNFEIEYTVIPEIVKLSGKMEKYSPTGRELNFQPVAEMAAETWEKVNQQNLISSIPQSDIETAFVIFHAGAGRDIELVGTTLNKTPQDIPSLYLSKNAFRNIFNDPAFEGFPLEEADRIIKNTLILPRTLSRPGEDISGNPFVLQLSINGLTTAQIGSHIGLPDLFDTESGQSGIGRFGLMDGAGIFSYNGLFPPEMSAWEKAYLGWIEPNMLSTENELRTEVPAVSLRQNNSVFKVELSKSEYFLIENRHRDPDNNGVTIDIQKHDGTIVSQTFTNSDRRFTFQQQGFEELLEPGVVVSVSDYDFSLPGGLFEVTDDTENFRELNGGILIWHIDENIIAEKINTNTINTGPGPNGVVLMEADGAQDIGNPVSNGLFSNESNGWAFDFWWSGNDASVITQANTIQLYQNRFGPDTTPDNSSNSGAIAGFELINFTDNLPVSMFTLRALDLYSSLYTQVNTSEIRDLSVSLFTSESNYWKAYPLSIQPIILENEPHFLIPGSDGVELLNPNKVSLFQSGIETGYSIQQPIWNTENQQLSIAENPEQREHIHVQSFTLLNQSNPSLWITEAIANEGFISQSDPARIDLDHTSEQINISDGSIIQNQNAAQESEQIDGVSSLIIQNQLFIRISGDEVIHTIPELSESIRKHTGIVQQSNGEIFVYLLMDSKMLLLKRSESFGILHTISEGENIEWPAFGDINLDGHTDILYVNTTSNTLEAKTVSGATLSFFPVHAPHQTSFMGTPLLSDIDGDGFLNILIQTVNNSSVSLHAFDLKGNSIDGFPLLIGGGATDEITTIHPAIHNQHLIAVSPEGELRLWTLPNNINPVWPAKYGNAVNNKVSAIVGVDEPAVFEGELIISEETYNWPNPARDFTTIRFLTSEAATVDIDIMSVSGKKVFTDSAVTNGAVAEEITVDTSQWASGAYFARLKAKGINQTEQKTIRIAIAK